MDAKPDIYDVTHLNIRLNNHEKLINHYTERWDNETKSQFQAIEALKKEVAAMKARSIEDAAKIGELKTKLDEANKRIDAAAKVVSDMKAKANGK